jgi:hypothetical protein
LSEPVCSLAYRSEDFVNKTTAKSTENWQLTDSLRDVRLKNRRSKLLSLSADLRRYSKEKLDDCMLHEIMDQLLSLREEFSEQNVTGISPKEDFGKQGQAHTEFRNEEAPSCRGADAHKERRTRLLKLSASFRRFTEEKLALHFESSISNMTKSTELGSVCCSS